MIKIDWNTNSQEMSMSLETVTHVLPLCLATDVYSDLGYG